MLPRQGRMESFGSEELGSAREDLQDLQTGGSEHSGCSRSSSLPDLEGERTPEIREGLRIARLHRVSLLCTVASRWADSVLPSLRFTGQAVKKMFRWLGLDVFRLPSEMAHCVPMWTQVRRPQTSYSFGRVLIYAVRWVVCLLVSGSTLLFF